MVLATKLNWYQTNHHTGTDKNSLSGYVDKAYKATAEEGADALTEAVVSCIHKGGHWASTKTAGCGRVSLRPIWGPCEGC